MEAISKLQRDCSDDASSSRIVTNRSRKAQVRHNAIIIHIYYINTKSRRFACDLVRDDEGVVATHVS